MRIKRIKKGRDYMAFVAEVCNAKGKTLEDAFRCAKVQNCVPKISELAPYPVIIQAIKSAPNRFTFTKVEDDQVEACRLSAERLYQATEQFLIDIAQIEKELS